MRKKKRKKRGTIYRGILIIIIIIVAVIMNINNSSIKIKYLEKMNLGDYYFDDLDIDIKQLEESLHIKRIKYNWNKPLKSLNNPSVIVFHHADARILSPEQINEIHKDKGWDGIGYHYYIRKDGTIYAGRPEESIGSHVYGDNKNTIGICLEGDFEEENATKEEMNSLVNLSIYLIIKYNIEECIGHNEVYNTLCPGEKFPKDEINNSIAEKLINKLKI